MIKTLRKNLLIIAVFLSALLATALCCLLIVPARVANAEGNIALPPDLANSRILDVNFDVNGDAYPITSAEINNDMFVKNNTSGGAYYRRYISSSALITAYNSNAGGAGAIPAGAQYVANSKVSSASASLSVGIYGTEANVELFVFTANMATGKDVYVKLQFTENSVVYDLYLKCNIYSNFNITGLSPLNNTAIAGNVNYVFVGPSTTNTTLSETLNASQKSELRSMTLANNSTTLLTADEYLKDRYLYKTAEVNGAIQYQRIKRADGTPWTVRDCRNYTFEQEGFGSSFSNDAFNQNYVSVTNPTANSLFTPSINFRTTITKSVVNTIKGTGSSTDFWSATHDVSLNLRVVGDTVDNIKQVRFCVAFSYSSPQLKDTSNPSSSSYVPTSLNLTSQYYLDITQEKRRIFTKNFTDVSSNTNIDTSGGYAGVFISANNIWEYAYAGDDEENANSKFFIKSATIDQGAGDSVEVQETSSISAVTELFADHSYFISAKSQGTTSITLQLNYPTGASGSAETSTTITMDGYGNYNVALGDIRGKRPVSYNTLTHAAFSELLSDGYVMTKVGVGSDEDTYVRYSLSNNVLTLEPVVAAIATSQVVNVTMTFTNLYGETIQITTRVNIDVTAGSLFMQYEDWQAGLIIAAIVIGCLIVVLLIVWLFLRGISKRKQDELAVAAPTSSYIIKLNTQLAAQQQRVANITNPNIMQIAAAPSAPLNGGTLQLAAGIENPLKDPSSGPLGDSGEQMTPPTTQKAETNDISPTSEQVISEDAEMNALIAGYISDEELLERIFIEKYEPKGMVRRTFFKSKDLQARELAKEKKRITDRYKTPMPMSEAILSEKQVAEGVKAKESDYKSAAEDDLAVLLGFNPDAPLEGIGRAKVDDEFAEQKLVLDEDLESHLKILNEKKGDTEFEIGNIDARLAKTKSVNDEISEKFSTLSKKLSVVDDENAKLKKDIEELEFKLASAKAKDKEKINSDIQNKEKIVARNSENAESIKKDVDKVDADLKKLATVEEKLNEGLTERKMRMEEIEQDIERSNVEWEKVQAEQLEFQKTQQLKSVIDGLDPLLDTADKFQSSIEKVDNENARYEKIREVLKSEIASLRSKLMSASDLSIINTINDQISTYSKVVSDNDKEISRNSKDKADLVLQMNAAKRKANEYIKEHDIELDVVISKEDVVIGSIALDKLKASLDADAAVAEDLCNRAQQEYDRLQEDTDALTSLARSVAFDIEEAEKKVALSQGQVDALNARLADATGDGRNEVVAQIAEKEAALAACKQELQSITDDGTRRKLLAQAEHDRMVDEAASALEDARDNMEHAKSRATDLLAATSPADLVLSGSGVISRDQRKLTIDHLKIMLTKARSADEQSSINSRIATFEAEQRSIDSFITTNSKKEIADSASAGSQEGLRLIEDMRKAADRKAEEEKQRALAEADAKREKAAKDGEEAVAKAREDFSAANAEKIAELNAAKEKAYAEAEELKNSTIEAAAGDAELIAEAEKAYAEALAEADNAYTVAYESLTEALQKEIEVIEARTRKALDEAEIMRVAAIDKAEAMRLQSIKESEAAKNAAEAERAKAEEEKRKALQEADKARAEAEEARRQANEERDFAVKAQEEARLKAEEEARKAEEEARKAQEEAEAAKLEVERAQEEARQRLEESERERQRLLEEAEIAKQQALEEAEIAKQQALEEAERAKQEALEEVERAKLQAKEEAEEARRKAVEEADKARLEAEEAKRAALEEADETKRKALEEAAAEAERIAAERDKALKEVQETKDAAQSDAEEVKRKAQEEADKIKAEQERLKAEQEQKEKEEAERRERIQEKVNNRKKQIIELRSEINAVKDDEGGRELKEKFYNISLNFDEDERESTELKELINKCMDDAAHAGEVARLKQQASKKPQRILKKVTERVNVRPAARPGGARPAAKSGARPAAKSGASGARPAARPGARPGASGARPGGARPAAKSGASGARLAARPGARPGAAGARPAARPGGARPAAKPGATGARKPTRPK